MRDNSQPPPLVLGATIGSIALVILVWNMPDSWRMRLPYSDRDEFYIGFIFLPMVALIVSAVIAKLREAKKAETWSQTTARIVVSRVEAKHHQFPGSETTVTNVPVVEYEFTVNGQKWRGNRISIGEDAGGANLEATLARYKTGTTVTVYYDPKHPTDCVLERDVPKGFGPGCAAIALFFIGGAAAIYYLTTNASHLLANAAPNADAPVTIFAACFGLVMLLAFFGVRHMMKQATNWPYVSGKIEISTTESHRDTDNGPARIYYTPVVEYSYTFNGNRYRSRRINLSSTTSGSKAWAEKVAARYPKGRDVEVHYDPTNPSNAALENPTGMSWLILAVAAACFGIAIYTSGVFK